MRLSSAIAQRHYRRALWQASASSEVEGRLIFAVERLTLSTGTSRSPYTVSAASIRSLHMVDLPDRLIGVLNAPHPHRGVRRRGQTLVKADQVKA
ncbi:hypothetical protein NOVOSPHI9U_260044 [Novosphingobium sp. 9U]|nr:hypothetical protein NOVOSPHI9U_260044 [Novosphingobium sp. 9U]